jgi:hypothetical protein
MHADIIVIQIRNVVANAVKTSVVSRAFRIIELLEHTTNARKISIYNQNKIVIITSVLTGMT